MSGAAATMLSPRALYRLHLATARHIDALPALKPLLSLALGERAPYPLHPLAHSALQAFLSGRPPPPPQPLTPPAGGGAAAAPVYSTPRSLAAFVADTARSLRSGAGGEATAAAAAAAAATASAAHAQGELARLADLGMLFAASPQGAAACHAAAHYSRHPSLHAPLAEADAVRPGTLLIEHPALLRPGRGLLLIYDIAQGIEEVEGHTRWVLRALAVNRPLHASAGAVLPHLKEALGPHLSALPLFYGGPSAPQELCIVHRLGELPGAVPLDGPPPPAEEEGGAGGGGEAELSHSRSGLFLGGELEALRQALASGRAKASDLRLTLGRTEFELEEEGGSGALRLPAPYGGSAQLCAAGPGVASLALCPALGAGPAAAAAPPLGYDFARFEHQNVAWSAALGSMAAWVEVGEAARGKEMKAWAEEAVAHAAVAHYFAAGMSRAEFLELQERVGEGGGEGEAR